MEILWWLVTILLFAVGLIGTVLPMIPGTTIILAAAIIHRVMVGGDHSVGWSVLALLGVLALVSYGLDFLAGYCGAKYFGASRWGTVGAVIGALVGIFFGLVGIFVGPVLGAIAGELISGKQVVAAGRAGWGSLLGNAAGMLGKLVLGLVMITIFLMAVPAPV